MTFNRAAEVFAYAARSEEESSRFYTALAESAPDFNTRQVLHSLAADEEEHRRILRMIQGNEEAPLPALAPAEEAGDPGPVNDVRDALEAAVRRETAAQELYEGLAGGYPPGYIRRSLEQMAAMEKAHRVKLEAILLNMRSGEVW